ncbi:hypothetical protein CTEN210_02149 [Chaetoceros tenuissimus]|uniref:Uncharacterized protein n=1 Tax=Chaetoceros tenuissimus TaxID=426638 RepID=A0AAD3CJ98_9STRA|nr:hypothetical protein CTEN210_02149 [Chaetoceros tenuissimus]
MKLSSKLKKLCISKHNKGTKYDDYLLSNVADEKEHIIVSCNFGNHNGEINVIDGTDQDEDELNESIDLSLPSTLLRMPSLQWSSVNLGKFSTNETDDGHIETSFRERRFVDRERSQPVDVDDHMESLEEGNRSDSMMSMLKVSSSLSNLTKRNTRHDLSAKKNSNSNGTLKTSSQNSYNSSSSNGSSSILRELEINSPDNLNLVLGMERTLFAALNNSWLLALGGIGLMSVGSGDVRATRAGICILSGGIVSALVAIMMHFVRLRQIQNNRPSRYSHTIIWSSIIALLTIITLALEMYFGILYPYLDRTKAVTITSGN